MRCILLVLVVPAMVCVGAEANMSMLMPPTSPKTTTPIPTSAMPTTQPATLPTSTPSPAGPTTPASSDGAQPLSECATPTFSMLLRSARNSTGVWTDEVECGDAVEQEGGRLPGGYRLDVEHGASYSCGGVERAQLSLTLTAPVLLLPPIGKL